MSDPMLELETPERVALSLAIAGVGDRALAWLADAVCIFLLWITALLVYSIGGDLLRSLEALGWLGQLLVVAGVFLSGWGWDVAWEVLGGGRTPGKRLAGLRVVRTDGAPVGLVESLARNLLRVVELPLGYAPAILAVALGPRRQRVGDLVAGTLVVRESRPDLSGYGRAGATGDGIRRTEFAALRGRAGPVLDAEAYERVADFLRRRGELTPSARARLGPRLAALFASRAGVEAPAPAEAEAFLEALLAFAAEGA
jgi:uncharacterized RDD family membrane protein YckC